MEAAALLERVKDVRREAATVDLARQAINEIEKAQRSALAPEGQCA
jgi:DNA-binding XRE family transcriptional regulator